MRKVVGVSINALEIAGSLCGVPFVGTAAIILKDICMSCDEMIAQKRKSKRIKDKCVLLLNTFNDNLSNMEGTELQKTADEVTAIFEKINGRIREWSRYNRLTMWLKNTEIGTSLDRFESELETALSQFQINSHFALHNSQRETMEIIRSNSDEMKELLFQLLTNRAETQRIIELQNSGEHIAEDIMGAGQRELAEMRTQQELMVTSVRSMSPSPQPRDSQQYLQYQRSLINFHRLTGIPPTVKCLNGEVAKSGDLAIAGGTYSDIWQGTWLGEEKVALKALRNIKASDPRAQKRFEHEITVWSNLKNDHILPFYGIVTDQGQHIHTVSPWQENGNVLDYVKLEPQADKFKLISGAAKGLEYLHANGVIHGNVKCANILVSASGEACICDFGMSKLIEEVTEKSASATLTASGSARWLAPELIEGAVSSPTKAADTYSFAMAILELTTGKHPFAERKRDASVIHDIVVLKKTPYRPKDKDACVWLTDDLWRLMQSCWHADALTRPSMELVSGRIQEIASSQDVEMADSQ
ncbi:TKL/TKL-ccin protein kinase [Crucibulum laeve]|uniref:TKL/TKL-ccin protein kinase n=1 Tax=Crucibulum laeve TaxID=68775 RepID=A0A5C3MBL3_9AGAR|nr:TKL/TKL-ccin protein kinase [Crucibulum laeve]